MATKKIIHCKFCDAIFRDEGDYAAHIERKHKEFILPGMVARQFVYYLRTGKEYGTCVVCKKKTAWNTATNKYNRLCGNPKCKEEMREKFKENMMDKYGKISLLDDPEQQRKMLANRKISGKYYWSDHNPDHVFTYTGKYELGFLIFLDNVFDLPPEDLMCPSPHTFYYEYEGKRHFYIPDMYIPSLNLEIEIKDGGDNPNTHPKIQAVDKVKEKLKDDLMAASSLPFNYLKVVNQKNIIFFKYLEVAKERELSGDKRKIVMV